MLGAQLHLSAGVEHREDRGDDRQLPVSEPVLQLQVLKELRGQAAVAAEQTDSSGIRNCRETREHTDSSQRDFNRDSEEIFEGQLLLFVQFPPFPVVMKSL